MTPNLSEVREYLGTFVAVAIIISTTDHKKLLRESGYVA
jgi:hypothetical protein